MSNDPEQQPQTTPMRVEATLDSNRVVITDFKMGLGSMVIFIWKWSLALILAWAIPAFIIGLVVGAMQGYR